VSIERGGIRSVGLGCGGSRRRSWFGFFGRWGEGVESSFGHVLRRDEWVGGTIERYKENWTCVEYCAGLADAMSKTSWMEDTTRR